MLNTMLIVLFAFQDGWSAEKPAALLKLEDARRKIQTADLTVSRLGQLGRPQEPYRRRLRFANGDRATHTLGFADGVAFISPDGRQSSMRFNYLAGADGIWVYVDGDHTADVYFDETKLSKEGPVVGDALADARALGLMPLVNIPTRLEDTLWDYPPRNHAGRQYRETQQDGLTRVEMRLDDGSMYVWCLDPQKDWNPVRLQAVKGTEVVAEHQIMLEQFGDVWFPRLIVSYRRNYEVSRLGIEAARINDPACRRA